MSVAITPLLRNALRLDAVVSGAAAALSLFAAPVIASLTGLPESLLFWSGAVLVPFVALLAMLSRRPTVPRLVLIDVVAINALWVAASLAVLVAGLIAPNPLGVAYVLAQALAVALFAALQAKAMRAAPLAA